MGYLSATMGPMEDNIVPGRRFAFVLRLWAEEDTAGQPALRGSLQLIQAAEVHYFSHLDQIPALLREVMGGWLKRSGDQDE